MNTKVTLSIDRDVIIKAKKVAAEEGKSLSSIIENYLKLLTKNEAASIAISEDILKLKGSVKLPESFDYKKELPGIISKKHLK